MIRLLFGVILSEMGLVMVLLFKTPLRKLVILGIDGLKRRRGPVIVKTVAGTVLIVLMSSVYSMVRIQKRRIEDAATNPTDQVLMAKHLLEATLMGGSLFLALMIDRQHHYIRELQIRRKYMEAVKKQSRVSDEGNPDNSAEIKALEDETSALRAKVKEMESEIETKTKALRTAEANGVALRKQSEGFLLEYDRLQEENQNLRNQLQAVDRRVSRSASKKDS